MYSERVYQIFDSKFTISCNTIIQLGHITLKYAFLYVLKFHIYSDTSFINDHFLQTNTERNRFRTCLVYQLFSTLNETLKRRTKFPKTRVQIKVSALFLCFTLFHFIRRFPRRDGFVPLEKYLSTRERVSNPDEFREYSWSNKRWKFKRWRFEQLRSLQPSLSPPFFQHRAWSRRCTRSFCTNERCAVSRVTRFTFAR